MGKFKNYSDLNSFIEKDKLINSNFFNEQKINMKKVLYVKYNRSYYQELKKRLRITIDKKITIYPKYPSQKILLNKIILETKFESSNFYFCNQFINENNLNNRNQKFSKYVNSFVELNEAGYF